MSRQLTFEAVVEGLQKVLHDLHDLSNYADQQPFKGLVITDVEFIWRDEPVSHWTIRIEPMEPPHPQPLTHVIKEMQTDETIRPGPEV